MDLEIKRGPECLFVKICTEHGKTESYELADEIWGLLEQHLTYRLVLDLESVKLLDSLLVGQLIALRKKIVENRGMIKLCGLSTSNQKVLHTHRLESHLPHYPTRHAAIMREYQAGREL